MSRVLFVSNGHGEAAIAARIAREVRASAVAEPEHLALVYAGESDPALPLVGPRVAMPSGGLVAMGNVRAFARDLGAGFARLFAAQIRYLRAHGREYDRVVAVGDVYALALAFFARKPVVFVGTAKSVHVAKYGPFERVLLRRAKRIFVRDEATAAALRAARVPAEAPGNVIVDLLDDQARDALDARIDPPEGWIGVLPGSRETAYEDGVRLARVVRALGERGLFSVAPGLEAARFARALREDGWEVAETADTVVPFEARDAASGARLLAWRGALGALLHAARLAIGQAGTANEAAAACGVPVATLDNEQGGWYRMRQRRLLGDALTVIPSAPEEAARALRGLLADRERMKRMGAIGRERMGGAGGARAIAAAIAQVRG